MLYILLTYKPAVNYLFQEIKCALDHLVVLIIADILIHSILNVSGSISLTDSTDIMEILEIEIGQDADVLYDLHVDKTVGDIISVTVLAAA